ncbi:MAG: hypothetical protein WBX02_08525, partial [Terriglobales bacterium]
WMWKFEHETGQREINQLHIPVGADIKMVMSSQDVIHSFFVPAFQGIVSDEQLNALVAYVKSLAQPPTGTAGLQNQPVASPAQPQNTQVQ